MKFLTISLFVTICSLQSAFAEIPEGQKEFECGAASEKGVLDALVLVQSANNEKGAPIIQYAFTKQEAMDNFLKAVAPQHYVLGDKITIMGKESRDNVSDRLVFLDCQEIK